MSWTELCESLEALVSTDEPLITGLSNAAALLYTGLADINWAGFYLLQQERLILGPFGGKPACTTIPLSAGVCGKCATDRKTIVVDDVDLFPGHIACDDASRSEIVTPIILKDGSLFGVIDIDAPVTKRFTESDRQGIEQFAAIMAQKIGSIA